MGSGEALDERCDVFAECGTHLESVARPSANQPDVLETRMPIDEKVAVGRSLVLAHPSFRDGRVGEGRESLAQDFAGAS
jgi:hypothetical protein